MSDENSTAGQRFDDDREEWPAPDPEELRLLEERLEELRAEGILSGSAGPRSTLRAIAHVPGALERFLKRRD